MKLGLNTSISRQSTVADSCRTDYVLMKHM